MEVAASREPIQSRGHATRLRLLEATVETIVERGIGDTTTTDVARRARVSQGALFRYFPTKALLLAEAARFLFAEVARDFAAEFLALGASPPSVADVFRLVRAVFGQPRIRAAFELATAARTDPELREDLEPIAREAADELTRLAFRLNPALANHQGFETLFGLMLDAFQGAAFTEMVTGDVSATDRKLRLLERWFERELSAGASP